MENKEHLLNAIGYGEFVVVDLETTGLDPATDKIIEIGAVRFKDGKEDAVFDQLINPGRPIPDFITKLTGITDDDVKDAPPLDKQLDQLLDFMGDAPLIGHQVNFDASFLEYQLREKYQDFDHWEKESQRFKYLNNLRMDTLFLSRIFLPFLERFKLGTVAAHFGIDLENAHRALDDSRATGHIFLELIERTAACDLQILHRITRLMYKNSARVKNFFGPIIEYKQQYNVQAPGAGILEDVAYSHDYFNIIGEKDFQTEHFEEESPLLPIDVDAVQSAMSAEGELHNVIDQFEEREQQEEMARLIGKAFNESEFLVVEAGTGTGKSMAYLLPAVTWAVQNREANERVIISTNTKNLQEQLFFKDIPTVYSIAGKKFKAVLLKGKSNYLCLDKWHATITDMNQRLSQQERSRILPLMLWAEQTQTGDIAENAGFQLNQNWGLWGKLIAENNYCPGRSCKHYNECFLMRARNNAKRADVIVVNHSLLFSDLVADHSILGEYHNLVFDEAHNLEKTAGDYLGVRFNWWTFRNTYHKLYEEEPKKAGALAQLEYRLNQGRVDQTTRDILFKQSNRLKVESIAFKRIALQFFRELSSWLRDSSNSSSTDGNRIRYHKNFRAFRDLNELVEELHTSMNQCRRRLSDLLDSFSDLKEESFQFQDQLHRELISIEADLENLIAGFDTCIKAEAEKHVFWLELPLREDSHDVTFNGVPLNVAEILKNQLYSGLKTAVFTSATLAVNGKFDYFKKRVGLDMVQHRPLHTALLGSPFDYEHQLMFGVTDFIDDPRNERFAGQLMELMKEMHAENPRGMLTLFTSYSMLNMMYNQLKGHFDAERVLLLAQGKSGSRTGIINQFREFKNSILFGTDSFWEGVDVPGSALEILVITKLPFDVPSEPLVAARMEEIKKSGGNPFFEYSVPEAIIKFRQGFGRLIRHKTDIGAVVVCDNRLSRMQYGKQFLNSLPVSAKIYKDKQQLFTDLSGWFEKISPQLPVEDR